MIDKIVMTDRTPIPLLTKMNPAWWLVGPDGWDPPTINNGTPYIPEVTNIWIRRFYWFICRNPLMNFVGFVLGVEDKNYTVYGSFPVDRTTGRDCLPPQLGWRWAVLFPPFSLGALLVSIAACLLAAFSWVFIILAVFAALKIIGPLPFASYWDGEYEFYYGWRPASGGFGAKFVMPKQ